MKNIWTSSLLLLAGCAAQNNWHWEKQASTQYEFNMDTGQCRAQAFSIPGAPPIQIALVYQSCMEGKGWYKVSN